ncbi:hypothetical protein X797_004724 [Metarhizium robertsii]|uniref:Uncharacterized protein n=2 Tax=Metarhizium robertsii TaxID=568076 RepID=E9FBH0_METRA|nr:uncharacterized protein MAA_09619 [Metarhizium robertsii ARSEF 23]EFY94908.1 hypothetical protein MAA_09619 [Metarhizium robertsii ARSEF 23]EXV01890.1 hypothetical protein X797_004724 [Metarhizium robertsii]
MAGSFDVDPQLCQDYAQFASNLDKQNFRIIYWTMFITNLIVLFFGSWVYSKAQKAVETFGTHSNQRARVLRRYIFICLGCLAVSTVVVVMEAYALLALQFCDGEDLMSLYWSTWTMLQVGSLIAIAGVILALCHNLRNRQHPPWALALGTPVLVIAGILHLFHDCTRKRIKKLRRPAGSASDDGQEPRISQANTIENCSHEDKCSDIQAEFIGFTVEGGPIVRFTQPVAPMPQGQLLGRDNGGGSTFAFPRGMVRFETEDEIP